MSWLFTFCFYVSFLFFPVVAIAQEPPRILAVSKELPHYHEVMRLMSRLAYSGLPSILKPQVTLSIDFDKGTSILHNVHEFDAQGKVLLEEGRYGLCAELATYVYEEIKGLFEDRYVIKFARVAESGFFAKDQSNHIVLMVFDKLSRDIFLIDPSYQRYGQWADLMEYTVLAMHDALYFVRDKSPDVLFAVDQAMPLYIKNDLLLSFAVASVDGVFNRDNYLFVVSVNFRYEKATLDVMAVGRRNGHPDGFERTLLLEKLFSLEEIKALHQKISSWVQ